MDAGRALRRGSAMLLVAGSIGAADAPRPGPIRLVDASADSGVGFRHHGGSRGRADLPEIMGGGVALIDADGDGRLDLYLTDGGPIGAGSPAADPPCRLYRNLGGMRFEDATARSGAPGPPYAMGAAVGDVDGDGRDDLLVTGWRAQRLYRNLGGMRFEDATARSGLDSPLWGTSAAFADLDGDGDLDLFVAAYLDYDPDRAPYCAAPDGRRDYCGPEDFRAQADRLYRNEGGGRFSDASALAGVDRADGRGLGVLIADLAGDARPDVFVANDGSPNHLFENRGGLRFEEVAEAAGVALDGDGRALAGMGVGLGDVDGDGAPDLLVANFVGRSTIAYRRIDRSTYRDATADFGLGPLTRPATGFGLALVDLDGDGAPDLIQANGHVLDRARLGVPFAMRPTLARDESGRFVDAAAGNAPWIDGPRLGRGLAVGDLDGDGRPDVVIASLDRPPLILRNASAGRFVGVDAVSGGPGHPPAVGARLRVEVGGRALAREVAAGGSYLSAPGRRLFVGLGDAAGVDAIEVRWPSGRSERWSTPKGPTIRLEEGGGSAVSAPR